KDDGIVIFNIGGALEGRSSHFLQAEYTTYEKVFPQVFVFKINPEKPDSEVQNLIMVAFKNQMPISSESQDAEISRLFSHLYKKEIPANQPILTDELAPVEYYNAFAQNNR
ncbi:MAG: hypothetical protein ABIP06_10880, partial [Pyrinomonadaceae bacterium]